MVGDLTVAASKKLVYLPQVNESTWLLMTKVRQGTCLRDYSTSPAKEDRRFTTKQLEEMLEQDGAYSERLSSFSRVQHTDDAFWREQIEFRNAESGLTAFVDERRMQERFKEESLTAISQRSEAALLSVFQRWTERFECIKQKTQFNHWDDDSASSRFNHRTGIGWTSQLLEASRVNRQVTFIPTECYATDFSLVAMELGFGISSMNNAFRKGHKDFIKPDGLALRRSGYFTVLEVKGPQDEPGLIEPMLQATCGGLAVVAKKNMLRSIARRAGGLRPAFHRAEIPINSRSLGIHILSQSSEQGGPRVPWTQEVETACLSVLQAFRQLEYIAYSFVTTQQAQSLNHLRTNVLITSAGVLMQ
jgi:hypothetical protein